MSREKQKKTEIEKKDSPRSLDDIGGHIAGRERMLKDLEQLTLLSDVFMSVVRTAKLMSYFRTADPFDDSEGELSKRVRFLKTEEGGREIMCEIMERIREEGRGEGREEGRKSSK